MAPADKTDRRGGRIIGIDVARALAIIGMFAVHIGPNYDSSLAGQLYALPHGRASMLFVLIAGVGVSLLAASRRATLADTRLRLAWTAGVLLPLGLALQTLDHGILVVLQTYAALFLVGIAALRLKDQWLLALAAGFALLGPLGFLVGEVVAPGVFDRAPVSPDHPPDEIVHGLVLSGPYPLITWAAPFLFGMWIGRRDLRCRRTWLAFIAGGAAAAIAALALSAALQAASAHLQWPVLWSHLVDASPHSQMPLWLIGSTGSAVFILGLAILVGDAMGRIVKPLAALGELALTFYVAHLLALHWWGRSLKSADPGEAALHLLMLSALAVSVAWAWRRVLPRGPLEMLLRAPWRLVQQCQHPAAPGPRMGALSRAASRLSRGSPGR